MKKIIVFVSVLSIAGSVFAAGTDAMDVMFKTWEGQKVKEAVKCWGNPTDIDYEQGQTKYTWEESGTEFIPGTDFQKKTACTRILITDTSGRIVYGKYTGNGCPFTSEGVKKWIHK